MAETWPSCMCMIGPYFLDKLRKAWWGSAPAIWWMFPMMGSFLGPGGRFGDLEDFDFLLRITWKERMREKMMSRKVTPVSIVFFLF